MKNDGFHRVGETAGVKLVLQNSVGVAVDFAHGFLRCYSIGLRGYEVKRSLVTLSVHLVMLLRQMR